MTHENTLYHPSFRDRLYFKDLITSFQRTVVATNCNGPIDAPDIKTRGNSIVQTSVRQAKADVQMPQSNFAKYSKNLLSI